MYKFFSCFVFILIFPYVANTSVISDFSSRSMSPNSEEVIPYTLAIEKAQGIIEENLSIWSNEYFNNIRLKLISDLSLSELQEISTDLEDYIFELFPFIEHVQDPEDNHHAPEVIQAYFKNQVLLALNTICLEKMKRFKTQFPTSTADD